MKEKIKKVEVKPNNDYVVWTQDIENIVRDAKLYVDSGCVAVYYVNGALKSVNPAGQWLLKSKEEDKNKSSLKLVCANQDKTFDILFGAGEIPFKDLDLNLETMVGAFGSCRIRLVQPWLLYTAMSKDFITSSEVDDYFKPKLIELMTTNLAIILTKFDYESIKTQQSAIAERLKTSFTEKLSSFGVDIEDVTLSGIRFQDEYVAQRQAAFEDENRRKREKEERRARERAQRAEVENVVAIANATSRLNVEQSPVQPVHPPVQNYNPDVRYCPQCGKQVSKTDRFCPQCGRRF